MGNWIAAAASIAAAVLAFVVGEPGHAGVLLALAAGFVWLEINP